ncbi:hypothetical protein DdX_06027 [Ditylenchus destructor]|uniref:C-type lectin domain-containing protein n=1 Tax=Ditylenchus destructor TaxID=166010 RepID=A0AAD4R687_9BILA|nr:hypothetical protein DdX_06027 [Ditylenchus destructor]
MMLSWISSAFLVSSIIPGLIYCYSHANVEYRGLQWKAFQPAGVAYDSATGDCTNNNNTLFRVFFQDSTFNEAESNCREYGGHLASFHSLEEMLFINEVVDDALYSAPFDSEANRDGYYRLWAGVYHLGEETCNTSKLVPKYKLYFVDGTDYDLPMDEETQKKIWYQSCCKRQTDSSGKTVYQLQPDNWGYYNEYCGAFKHMRSTSKLRLGDKSCSMTMKAHVCKYQKSTTAYKDSLPWRLRLYG